MGFSAAVSAGRRKRRTYLAAAWMRADSADNAVCRPLLGVYFARDRGGTVKVFLPGTCAPN